MLLEREKRWETLNTDHRRNITVSGQAGVYELQEGIFLMCDEYEDTMDGRVGFCPGVIQQWLLTDI